MRNNVKRLRVGIIGLGYWGPNYVRNFSINDDAEVVWLCDLSETALDKSKKSYPHLKITKDVNDIFTDPSIDCVAIATPPESHYTLAKKALLAKKHVFIAKPLATKLSHAKELLDLAKQNNLLLHVDLTYLYTSGIRKIKTLVDNETIGKPLYYDSTRSNLGLIQKSVNVIWDLAPHDLAILDYCFGLKAKKIFAVASRHFGNAPEQQMAHIMITYEKNFTAHIHVSWISPVKIRSILIGGTKKMISFNDVEPDEKIKIYDKGIDISLKNITPFTPVYRTGDVMIPKLENEEALSLEINEFLQVIKKRKFTLENAKLNVAIVSILEACDASIKKSKPIEL